jgi:hypothetical protein
MALARTRKVVWQTGCTNPRMAIMFLLTDALDAGGL